MNYTISFLFIFWMHVVFCLEKGDLIAIVFPAFSSSDQCIASKIDWLESKGYKTRLYPSRNNPKGDFSGSDEERAAALMDAFLDEEVKAIWCFRGGYGCMRILDLLDYEKIKAHPKTFIGMSDVTALHQAIGQKTGLVTFLAPVLKYFDSGDFFDDLYALDSLESVLQGDKQIILPHTTKLVPIVQGEIEGELVGGNLTIVAALCGTQWQINTEGKVLILEDIDERVYRLDRLLWQLKEAGLLANPAAVILGDFVDCGPTFLLDRLFEEYFGNAPYPVIKGFPSGHGKYQATLPLHATISLKKGMCSLTV